MLPASGPHYDREVLRAGQLELRPGEFVALCRGRALPLTVRELALLTALMRRGGRILSREELYALAWGAPYRSEDRSVDVYIRKLRVKLERELPGWRFIHTHFGFGYRFAPEAVPAPEPQPAPRALSQVLHNAATPS